MLQRIQALADKHFACVVALRRRFHSNPELAYQEFETAALVAQELRALGLEVQTGIATTGVVGILKGREPESRCVALRADMDALPIVEQNEVDYKSRKVGLMHACGHDVHTANLLGVAMILAELKEEIQGTVKFIFQPSEEKIPSGAEAMIRAGVLQNPVPQRMYGLHVHPEMEAGQVGFCAGKFMASSDEIYLTVIGKGGHAAQPAQFNSPLLIAAELLLELKKVTDLTLPIVLSFGKIEGLGATNVIPEKVTIAGTLRCFDEALRAQVQEEIKAICHSVSTRNNGGCEVEIKKGYPVLINEESLTKESKELAAEYVGKANVFDLPIRMGSEDFAYYTHEISACFFRLGVGNKSRGITSAIHTPTFDIDESALRTSMGLMSWFVLQKQT